MKSKKKKRTQSKRTQSKRNQSKRTRCKKGALWGKKKKIPRDTTLNEPKQVKAIVKCKHFLRNGENYNNLPYAVFLSAMLCRASYEYDALFMHLLVFIFNLKETQNFLGDKLKRVESYKDLINMNGMTLEEPTFIPRSFNKKYNRNPFGIVSAKKKMVKRINKKHTFNNKGAQHHGTIYNTALEILGSNRKLIWETDRHKQGNKKDRLTYWNLKTHEKIFDDIYSAEGAGKTFGYVDGIVDKRGTAENLNFVMIQNSHDLNLYVIYDKKSNTIVLAFRGTSSLASTKDDLKPFLHSHTTGNKNENDGMIHCGFGQQLNGSINRIINAMKYVYEKDPSTPAERPKIFVCGHSLGGANSELFCYYYQKWIPEISKVIHATYLNQPMTLVTWGAPRIGNMSFIKKYDDLLILKKIILLRCTTDGDLIPSLPFEKLEYYHPGKTIDKSRDAVKGVPPSHRFVCADRLNSSLQTNYSKPLMCDERFWCNKTPGFLAHSNAAYVSFGGLLRTATIGSGLPKNTLYLRKNDFSGQNGVKLIKVKEYRKNDYVSEELYNAEMVDEVLDYTGEVERYSLGKHLTREVHSVPKLSWNGDERLVSKNEFGTSMFKKDMVWGSCFPKSEARDRSSIANKEASKEAREILAKKQKQLSLSTLKFDTSEIPKAEVPAGIEEVIDGDANASISKLDDIPGERSILRPSTATAAVAGGKRRTRKNKKNKRRQRTKKTK
jgi:hypothetical protein